MADAPKIPGIELVLDGESFIVAPLKLGQFRELAETIAKVEAPETDNMKRLEGAAAVIAAALARNYPEITAEQVFDRLDLGNWAPAYRAAMAISGLVPRDGRPGEATPATGS